MQNIPVLCPFCQTRYQLDPQMRGKRMRCPNNLCKEVFVVQEEGTAEQEPPKPSETPPSPTVESDVRPGQITGTVGKLIPILPVESIEPAVSPPRPVKKPKTTPPPKPAPAVSQAPPVEKVQVQESTPVEPVPPPAQKVEATIAPEIAEPTPDQEPRAEPVTNEVPPTDGPLELAAGLWDAPPVRHEEIDFEDMERYAAPEETIVEEAPPAEQIPVATKTRRRNFWIVAALFALLAGAGTLGVFLVQEQRSDVEEERSQLAKKAYQENQFAEAARLFHYLELDFPESEHRSTYHFMGQLSSLRDAVYSTEIDVKDAKQALTDFLTFLKEEQGNPLLAEQQGNIWQTLHKAADDFIFRADLNFKKDTRLYQEVLGLAQAVLAETAKYKAPTHVDSSGKLSESTTFLKNVKDKVNNWSHRQELLELLELMAKQPLGNVVERAHTLVQQYAEEQAELKSDPEVLQLVGKMPALHRAGVKYTALALEARSLPLEKHINLYLAEPVKKGEATVASEHRPLLALARGVLYALDPVQGNVRWAVRVGFDTTTLPLWLPPTPVAPERLLLVSSDRRALVAVEAETGSLLWEQPLPGPCLGAPLLLGKRAFVAQPDGRIDEIDTLSGKLLGYYEVGQPLTGWGAAQPGSSLLYFPAESYCVFVLDANQHRCINILYSKHPGNTVRGQPIVASQNPSSSAGVLVLNQIEDLDKMTLRFFGLLVEEGEQKDLLPPVRLDGWTGFPPLQTPEKMSLVTSAGHFASFGFRQALSHDPPVFPLSQHKFFLSQSFLPPRAQVVHTAGNTSWVMVHGQLHRLQAGFSQEQGQKLFSWQPKIDALGSPLHASQVRTTTSGETAMYLVTQSGEGEKVLASALETPLEKLENALKWQMRLGLSCQPPLLALGEKILALDQSGTVRIFDPARIPEAETAPWLDAQKLSTTFPSRGELIQTFTDTDPKGIYILCGKNSAVEPTLKLWKIDADEKVQDWDIPLNKPLAGTGGLGKEALILPLSDGRLYRFALGQGSDFSLLNWRSKQADEDAPGHVLCLGGDDYLISDGSKGLLYLHWAAGQAEQIKGQVQLPSRIAQPPLLIPRGKDGSAWVAVTDAENGITLLETKPFRKVTHWQLKGNITAGPFVRGGLIGCLVDQQELHWFDPSNPKATKQHTWPAPLVGPPQLVGKDLLVADGTGRIALLDPKTGKTQGPGYHLNTIATPSVAPVFLGKDRLFVPLTDGTVILLSAAQLKSPAPNSKISD